MAARAAGRARDEPGYFAELRAAGVLVRPRFSDAHPGQVTGYSLAMPGRADGDGEAAWFGGGRLAESLSLPRLRRRWNTGTERPAPADHRAVRCSVAERNLIYDHAARHAAAAADQVRAHAAADPALAADAAHAAAGALHVLAALTGNPGLRRAASAYDRAARAPHGRTPPATREGTQLRAAARLLALTGPATADSAGQVLSSPLAVLADAVAELHRSQRHAAQAAAARASAESLREVHARATKKTTSVPDLGATRRGGLMHPVLSSRFPRPTHPGLRNSQTTQRKHSGR
jgi:hypothetical protein